MKSICVERLKVDLEILVESVQSMEVKCRVNEHAVVHMEVRTEYRGNYLDVLEELIGSSIQIDEVLDAESRTYRRIFCGLVKKASLAKIDTFLTIMISGISCSHELDKEKRSCSFQDKNKTYRNVMKEIICSSNNAMLRWDIQEETSINRFLMQYEETDWEFLKRLASQIHVPLIADEKNPVPIIHVGIMRQEKRDWDIEELFVYEKGVDKSYRHILKHDNSHADFVYYAFKSRKNYNICDWFLIENELFLIAEKKILFDKGELLFAYKIVKEAAFREEEKYNDQIKGISLCGEIKEVEKENVYIKLDVDKENCCEYAFLWEPIYGNLTYCMPECGERIRLHFPSEDEQEARVIQTVRRNGGDYQNPKGYCETFQAEQNRVFTTNRNKQLRLYPDELSLESKGSDCFKNLLELKDCKGISINTPQKIEIEAAGDVTFYAGKIFISALQEIMLKGKVSSIQINRNFNLFSPNLIENCGMDSNKRKPVRTTVYKENKSWINNYQAIASIPAINLDNQKYDSKCMCAVASLPSISDGRSTVSMSELLNGTRMEDTSFPSVFSSMESKTMNGGYPPPVLDE